MHLVNFGCFNPEASKIQTPQESENSDPGFYDPCREADQPPSAGFFVSRC